MLDTYENSQFAIECEFYVKHHFVHDSKTTPIVYWNAPVLAVRCIVCQDIEKILGPGADFYMRLYFKYSESDFALVNKKINAGKSVELVSVCVGCQI